MGKIIDSAFIKKIVALIDNMYRLGWHERNSGNITYQLLDSDIKPYLSELKVKETIELNDCFLNLANNYYLVTGTGKHFRNIKEEVEEGLGIIRISEDGTKADII